MTVPDEKLRGELLEFIKWARDIVHCSHEGLPSQCKWPFCVRAEELASAIRRLGEGE